METIKNKDEFNDYLQLLKDRFSQIQNTTEFNWSNINSILMLTVKKNWTAESSNSNYQINSDNVKDFFPILQISDSFPHWRLSMPAFISNSVLSEFTTTQNTSDWIEAKISYRHKIQNSYPYLQLTLEDDLRGLKNNLKENDEIFFVREHNTSNYFVFASREKIFNKDSILIINPEMASTDKTVFELDEIQQSNKSTTNLDAKNVIFYGSPGTGKSREVNKSTNGFKRTRITFHPETDYHSFVGSYKPVMEGTNIKYDFVPQAFTKAYCNAWLNPNEPYFLIIEELNRGNCAQIFGDIFQCLDRDSTGQSEYGIDCDKDLAKYLKEKFEKDASPDILENYKKAIDSEDFDKIILPSNLYIYATMNTSDQSLFPMDSAFKRRWDMKFVPVDYEDANNLEIVIDKDTIYNWGNFISIINPKIKELTGSEDKQLGNRFINPSDGKITFEQFRSKVLFYLWSEIYKDEVGSLNSIFKYQILDEDPIEFQFGELFEQKADAISQIDLFKGFMHFNGVETTPNK
jgi:hypothetical protein